MKGNVFVLVYFYGNPLFAHHGGTSLYDMSKEVTLEATVTEFYGRIPRGDRFRTPKMTRQSEDWDPGSQLATVW